MTLQQDFFMSQSQKLPAAMLISSTLLTSQGHTNETETVKWTLDSKASIVDTSTTIKGVHHIGLSVKELEPMLNFYQASTGFKLIERKTVSDNPAANTIYGQADIKFEYAVLESSTMRLELYQFATEENSIQNNMPVQGPGITHTCYQSAVANPLYDKFTTAGASIISRGDEPVDAGGYGVRYAYARDLEGNIFELEEIDQDLIVKSGYDSNWQVQGENARMTQVAFATHDLNRLIEFYAQILDINPYRAGSYSDNRKLDEIANIDNLSLNATWFKMDGEGKVLEFWEYNNPKTTEKRQKTTPTQPGYSFSFEVGDIQKEYTRMRSLGVSFIAPPQQLGDYLISFAHDPDGNVFSLRQKVL
jgi:catechol 2,3-dioxygenase-like lactoylglutathione lyase family enzyme